MTLKKVVEHLNEESYHNAFKLSEHAAKMMRQDRRAWAVVRFVNSAPWRDFSPHRVELFECVPPGWPLKNVAARLGGVPLRDLHIVSRYDPTRELWLKADITQPETGWNEDDEI